MARVMVVEDEGVVAMDLCSALAAFGHDVPATFMTGEDAVEGAAQLKPDLIMMDVRLRGKMDGIEAAGCIRSAQDMPIIFLTAFADQETVARAAATEAHGYLMKPYDDKELRATVELALFKHRMETQRRERERWFATTLRSIGDAVVAVDQNGQITFLNAIAEKLTGWSAHEALGRPIAEVLRLADERTRKTVPAPTLRAVEQNAVVGLERATVLIAKDGSEQPIDDSAAPICDEQGKPAGAVLVFREITERRKLEKQLAATQRLAALGTFTIGVAHEINNPLAYDLANQTFALDAVEHLLSHGGARPEAEVVALQGVCQALREGIHGAERVKRIVSDLKSFSRPQVASVETFPLEEVLLDAARFAGNEINCRARFVREVRSSPGVAGDRAQLAQVVINLLVNAAQAIPEGAMQANEIRLVLDTEGDCAVVLVQDTGCGMSPETMVRMFDPFFTTKPAGIGTGLGLSICHGIVAACGGRLTAHSQPGAGSTFRLELPARPVPPVAAPPVAAQAVRTGGRALPAQRLHVLIVDDEAYVGSALRRALLPRHEVTVLRSGAEALVLLDRGEQFDTIICDLMMPTLSGMDLHERVHHTKPDLARRMIFLTGGAFTGGSQAFAEKMQDRVLDKPVDLAQLHALLARQQKAAG